MRRVRASITRPYALLTAFVLAMCVTAPAAQAANNYTQYWSGSSINTNRHADATRTTLTSSRVQDFAGGSSGEVWAGAHYSGGDSLYASWATAINYACHNYGTSNIGAMYETPYQVQNVVAYAGWTNGSDTGWYC